MLQNTTPIPISQMDPVNPSTRALYGPTDPSVNRPPVVRRDCDQIAQPTSTQTTGIAASV